VNHQRRRVMRVTLNLHELWFSIGIPSIHNRAINNLLREITHKSIHRGFINYFKNNNFSLQSRTRIYMRRTTSVYYSKRATKTWIKNWKLLTLTRRVSLSLSYSRTSVYSFFKSHTLEAILFVVFCIYCE
jgi:hypothetical protein